MRGEGCVFIIRLLSERNITVPHILCYKIIVMAILFQAFRQLLFYFPFSAL